MLLHTAGHTCGGLPASASTRVSACMLSHAGCPQSLQSPSSRQASAFPQQTPFVEAVFVSQGSHAFVCNRSPLSYPSCRQQRTRPLKTCAHSKREAQTAVCLQAVCQACNNALTEYSVLQLQGHQQNQLLGLESRIPESRILVQITGTSHITPSSMTQWLSTSHGTSLMQRVKP